MRYRTLTVSTSKRPFAHLLLITNNILFVFSDHLKHNTATFHYFQRHWINHIKETLPKTKTDGVSTQHKNKNNFANLCYHKHNFDVDAEWHFFSSAHGKNECDGIGGTMKHELAEASLQRTLINQIMTRCV